nr:MAK10-like protein [Tanacetum cinerariifolium]
TVGQTQNVYAPGAYQGGNSFQPQVERETEVTKDTVHPTNNRSTKDVQPPVVQIETPVPNFEPIVAPIIEPVVAPITLGWHLEEIHVTWAHLGKKQTILQLYTKVKEEKGTQTLETASQPLVTTSNHQSDGVRNFETASRLNPHSETLEDSVKRRRDYSRPSHEGYRNTIELPDGNNVVPLRSDTIRLNNPKDFAKPVKAISLPQDVSCTSDLLLIELANQVQCLMEAHLASKSSIQVNKITSSCEICSGPHDTQYCMQNSKQAFVEYESSRTDEAGGKWFTLKPEQNNLGDTYNMSWKSNPNLRWRQP